MKDIVFADGPVKLEKMAACIAHEIKNPLAGISSNIQVLKSKLPSEDHRRKYVDIVLEEIDGLEVILDRFLMLARPVKPVKQDVDLNDLVERTVCAQREKTEKEKINLVFLPDHDLPAIKCDPYQIKQVLLNLLVNAVNVVQPGGNIEIKTGREDKYFQISIEDNGSGIRPEDLGLIFEPFFSTSSKGIGLGLTISRQIAKEHEGDVQVKSMPGSGSVFTLLLPTV